LFVDFSTVRVHEKTSHSSSYYAQPHYHLIVSDLSIYQDLGTGPTAKESWTFSELIT